MTADIHDIYLSSSSSQLTTIIRLAKGTRALINFVVRWSIHNLPRDNWGERPAWGPLNSCFPRLLATQRLLTNDDTFNWKTLWTNQKTLIPQKMLRKSLVLLGIPKWSKIAEQVEIEDLRDSPGCKVTWCGFYYNLEIKETKIWTSKVKLKSQKIKVIWCQQASK